MISFKSIKEWPTLKILQSQHWNNIKTALGFRIKTNSNLSKTLKTSTCFVTLKSQYEISKTQRLRPVVVRPALVPSFRAVSKLWNWTRLQNAKKRPVTSRRRLSSGLTPARLLPYLCLTHTSGLSPSQTDQTLDECNNLKVQLKIYKKHYFRSGSKLNRMR